MKAPIQKIRKELDRTIKEKESQKIKERQRSKRGLWYSLGIFGIVGWSVVVPTLLGTMLGIWLDKRLSGNTSWTLTLLIVGLVIGCICAWQWLSRENKEIHNNGEDNNE